MSPYKDENNGKEKLDVNFFSFNDQLGEIMKSLGPLGENDKSFLNEQGKLEYINTFSGLIENGDKN